MCKGQLPILQPPSFENPQKRSSSSQQWPKLTEDGSVSGLALSPFWLLTGVDRVTPSEEASRPGVCPLSYFVAVLEMPAYAQGSDL